MLAYDFCGIRGQAVAERAFHYGFHAVGEAFHARLEVVEKAEARRLARQLPVGLLDFRLPAPVDAAQLFDFRLRLRYVGVGFAEPFVRALEGGFELRGAPFEGGGFLAYLENGVRQRGVAHLVGFQVELERRAVGAQARDGALAYQRVLPRPRKGVFSLAYGVFYLRELPSFGA